MNSIKKPILFISFAFSIFASFVFINHLQAAEETQLWGATGINITNDAAHQEYHSSVPDGSGGLYAVWNNSNGGGNPVENMGVFLQRYDSNGAAIWGAPVHVFTSGFVFRGIEQDGSGGVIILASQGFVNTQAARVTSAGSISWTQTVLSSGTSLANRIFLEKDSSNNFFALYEDKIQKFDTSGTVAWGAGGVDYTNDTFYLAPNSITPLENGGAAVVWMSNNAGQRDVYAQVISSAGAALGAPITVSAEVGRIEGAPVLAKADGTNFYAVYSIENAVDDFYEDIKVKKFSAAGVNQFVASGITLVSSLFVSSSFPNTYAIAARETTSNDIIYTHQLLGRALRINTAGTLLWTANFEAASIVGDIRSIALSSDQLEFGIVISNINHLRLLSVATATGVLNSNMPIASYVGNQYYATHIPLHATSQGYFVSWQYSTTSSFPIPYDTFIQKMFSANYGPYQVTGVISPAVDVLAYGVYSIKDGSAYGLNDSDIQLLVTEDGLPAASIPSTNMTADRNWSSLEADVDAGADKTYFGGVGSLAGVVGSTYTLYNAVNGRDIVVACTNSTSIFDLNYGCSGGAVAVLNENSAGVSKVSMGGGDYWAIETSTYKGAVSIYGHSIINLNADLDVFDVATGDNMETGKFFGSYTVRIVHAATSNVLAELDIEVPYASDLDWSSLTYGSTATETYLGGVTSLPGIVGSDYNIMLRKGPGDTNVYTCPTAANVSQVEPACAGVINLGVSATDLSIVNVGGTDFWKYSNFTDTNLGRETVPVLLGDILIIYVDSLNSSNSAQQMYDYLDSEGYDVTLNGSEGVPSVDTLNSYNAIIYTQGDGYGFSADLANIDRLKEYMNTGLGRIFFEGEEVVYESWDEDDSPDFIENYLRTAEGSEDYGNPELITVTNPTHPITQGLPASSTYTVVGGSYADQVDPINGAEALISGDFGGFPGPILSAYDNDLTCTSSKKTVLYTAVWKNDTEGIDDAAFREPMLANIVDWLLDNPCTVDNLPVAYNLTSLINSSTVNLETTGASGTVDGNLKTATDEPLADIEITLNGNIDWSTLNLTSDPLTSKIFSGNILDMEGAGNEYTLYVPIAPAHAGITQVSVCVGVASLVEVTNACPNIGTLTDGQTDTISGQNLTATIVSVDGSNYWRISGFTAAAGALVTEPAEEEPPVDPEDPEDPTPTPTPSPSPADLETTPTSFPVVTVSPVSGPVVMPVEPDNGIGTGGEPIPVGEESVDESEESLTFGESINKFIKESLKIEPEVLVAAVAVTTVVSSAALVSGSFSNYSGYFMGILVWRRRKYWGLIYEIGTSKPIALVTVRVFRKQGGNKLYISQTIGDFEGKYGLNISDPGEYIVEFIRDGFKTVQKEIFIARNADVILDVGLHKLTEIKLPLLAQIRYFWKENAPSIMQTLRGVVIVFLIWGLSTTINVINESPSFGNYMIAILYFALLLLQAWLIIAPFFGIKTGSIVDSETKKPLKGAIFRIINLNAEEKNIENLAISNSSGVIKLRTKPGQYQFIARMMGYQTVNGVTLINESGKLSKQIELSKSTEETAKFGQ